MSTDRATAALLARLTPHITELPAGGGQDKVVPSLRLDGHTVWQGASYACPVTHAQSYRWAHQQAHQEIVRTLGAPPETLLAALADRCGFNMLQGAM